MITYVEGKFTVTRKSPKGKRTTMWGTFYPGQSMTGYGGKISTDYAVQFEGERRWHRVYATCYSNVASHWIVRGGKQVHLHDYDFDGVK